MSFICSGTADQILKEQLCQKRQGIDRKLHPSQLMVGYSGFSGEVPFGQLFIAVSRGKEYLDFTIFGFGKRMAQQVSNFVPIELQGKYRSTDSFQGMHQTFCIQGIFYSKSHRLGLEGIRKILSADS